jgi:hypothetical protein
MHLINQSKTSNFQPSLNGFLWFLLFPILIFSISLTGNTILLTFNAEAASCGYIKLTCPSGQKISRKTKWDKKTLRCVTTGSLEKAVRSKCRSPGGVPKSDLKWWYSKVSQRKVCSGPIGGVMSGPKFYRFLHESCLMHDLCYAYTTSKKTCEKHFLKNMTALCKNKGITDVVFIGACMSMAGVVYAAAKKHKGFKQAYKGRQKELLKHQKRWTVRNRVYIDCDHSKVKSESTRSKVTIQVLSSSKKVIATKTYGRGISKKAVQNQSKFSITKRNQLLKNQMQKVVLLLSQLRVVMLF